MATEARGAGAVAYRIRYDAEQLERRLSSVLDELALAMQRPSWREAMGERWLMGLSRGLEGARARLRRPFCLLVVGDFKRGKSTLINALLEHELVTTDVTPETVAITELCHGPELRAEIALTNGGRVDIDLADLPRARLDRVMENLPAEAALVRVLAPVEMLRDMMVVDSPGMGDLLWRFDRRVQGYMPEADAILHVTSALSPLSETERSFLELSLRPLDLSKVLFVVNMIDSLPSADDTARVLARITERVRAGFPDAPVFGVSALHEMCRLLGEEQPPRPERAEELADRFRALREHLERALMLHRDLVRTERAAQAAGAAIEAADQEAERLLRALGEDRETLDAALARARDEGGEARAAAEARRAQLREKVSALAEVSAGWMRGLVRRIESDVLPSLEKLEHEQIQRHFPFFLAGAVRDGVAACLDAHQDELMALVNELSEQEPSLELSGLGETLDRAAGRASFQGPTWTFFDHLHVVGAILGGVTGMIAPLLAGLADRKMAQQVRAESYRQRFSAALPGLEEQVVGAVRGAYQEIADRVCAHLEAAEREEQERLAGVLGQAIALHERGEAKNSEAVDAIGAARARLGEARRDLEALRGELRAAAAA